MATVPLLFPSTMASGVSFAAVIGLVPDLVNTLNLVNHEEYEAANQGKTLLDAIWKLVRQQQQSTGSTSRLQQWSCHSSQADVVLSHCIGNPGLVEDGVFAVWHSVDVF